ncbi:MAG: hypothetical protein U0802_07725 [Candidatus Binatia bacterium]
MDAIASGSVGNGGEALAPEVLRALAAIDRAATARRLAAPVALGGVTEMLVAQSPDMRSLVTSMHALYDAGGLRLCAGTSVRTTGRLLRSA